MNGRESPISRGPLNTAGGLCRMTDKNGKRIFVGDLISVGGKHAFEVYGGSINGTELWYYDHIDGRFKWCRPEDAVKL